MTEPADSDGELENESERKNRELVERRRRLLAEMAAEVGRMPEDEIPGHDGFVETR